MSTEEKISDEKAVFRFRRIASDMEGYYHDRWDNAVPVNVIAANQTEARDKADRLSGEPPRGSYWKFRLDRIDAAALVVAESLEASK